MLYISSRNKTDSFTAHRTLCDECAPDGGLYLAYQLPQIEKEMLQKMCGSSFGQNVAHILNLFFSEKLTAWDIECCVGRAPVRIAQMNHRIITAECFHNPQNTYGYLEENLFRRLLPGGSGLVTSWAGIAIRIAVMFGLYAAMPAAVRDSFDVAVPCGDFSAPMAMWYARKMGLPIRTIICCCNENGAVWDLIQRGEFNTGMPVVNTGAPKLDQACPSQIERLVYHTLGLTQTLRYNEICGKRGVFHLDEVAFGQLSDGMAAAVVGQDRVGSTIRSVYRTSQYFISPESAILYGGLQDYRARSGESRYTLILAEDAPELHAERICNACGITRADFTKTITSVKE